MGPVAIVDFRLQALKSVLALRQKLAPKKAAVHATLHPDLQACLRGKQTCLWHELLKQTGFPDLQLVEDVRQGFEVIGPNPWSPVFLKGYKPPQITPEQLASQAAWRRQKPIQSCKPSVDPALDEELWKQTMAERDKGWVSGPYASEAEVSEALQSAEWLCTKRFPLQQGEKIRLIDDALASGVNAAFSTFNKLKLMDVDTLVSLIILIMRCTAAAGESKVALSTGETLKCTLHPLWGNDFNLVGRTLDLSSAYKQLGMRPESQLVRPIVAWSPLHKRPVFFIASALMFGTTGSVFAFNRAALSLWHLALSLGKTWLTCYFDDFPGVELTRVAGSSRTFMEGLLKALGWQFAESGKKALPYAPVFHALGVTLDVSACGRGKLTVSNKKGRVEELKKDAARILDAGLITKQEAAAFHGRLNFAQGQLFGCLLKPAMHLLSQWAENKFEQGDASKLAAVMTYVVTVLETAPPRSISVHDHRPPVLIFTDGAFEPDDPDRAVGAGAVVIDAFQQRKLVAEISVPEALVSLWQQKGRKQIIMRIELWPALVVLLKLGASLRNRRVLFFIDNNGARDALIKGTSPVEDVFSLLAMVSVVLNAFCVAAWLTRVPSPSNLGDAPSRGKAAEMAELLGCAPAGLWECEDAVIASLVSRASFVDFMARQVEELSLSGRSVAKRGECA